MPNDIVKRDGFKPHLNKRLKIRGHFSRFDSFHDFGQSRDYPCVILNHVVVGDELLADHLWVHRAHELRSLDPELDLDEEVVLTGTVREYKKRQTSAEGKPETVVSYFLDRPDGLELPGRTRPALRPRAEVVDEFIRTELPALNGNHGKVPAIPNGKPLVVDVVKPSLPADYFLLIQECKGLAKKLGGLAELKRLVDLLLEE